jgi:cytochrome c-type biogenesis protein CcmH/NrfG
VAWLEDLLRRGFRALQERRHADASRHCRAAVAAAPTAPEAHFLVGLVALDINDAQTAARAFGSVVKLQPKHAAAWAQLARLFMRMGQPARAEKALAEAIGSGVSARMPPCAGQSRICGEPCNRRDVPWRK